MKSTSQELEWYICWYCREYFLGAQKLEEHNLDHHGNQDDSETVHDERSIDDYVDYELWEHPAIASSIPLIMPRQEVEGIGFGTNFEAESLTAPVNAIPTSQTKTYQMRDSNGQLCEEEKSCKSKSSASTLLIRSSLSNETSKNTMTSKSLRCDFCDKAFRSRSVLQLHTYVHTGEKPFSCRVCEYALATKGNLQIHMLVHTKEKPFSCHICERVFADKTTLKKHMFVHTKEKPFSCHICEYAFKVKYDLNRHMKVHTKEKAFPCKSWKNLSNCDTVKEKTCPYTPDRNRGNVKFAGVHLLGPTV